MKALVLLGTVCAFLVTPSWGLRCHSCAEADCQMEVSEQMQENCDNLIIIPGKEFYCGTGFSDDSREKVVRRMCIQHEPDNANNCFSSSLIPGAEFSCLCSGDFCNDHVSHRVTGVSSTSKAVVALLASNVFAAFVAV
ncbi:unnamed protein product [Darwinula stevensoni]|uniref:Protein quiver n=1 Tax=Darwinula stevensoni TaxID=69355 RepID=A0A7R9A6H2_9CRUS|nr:unnamed protein product [Darwinula stevensoni]CAG0894565.1 unnamed protein product [Darwinula stevensoni]